MRRRRQGYARYVHDSAPTVSASIKDCYLSHRAPRVVRWSCEAAALPRSDVQCRPAAHPCAQCQCISQSPQRTPECATIPEVAPGHRQSQAVATASALNSKRLSGFPVCRDDSQPWRQRAAPKSPSVDRWHQGGKKILFSSLSVAVDPALRPGRSKRSDQRLAGNARRSGTGHITPLRLASWSARPVRNRSRCSRM